MRVLFGMILGAALTIGGTYLYDSSTGSSDTTPIARPIVNWDVVGDNWGRATARVREEWQKLAAAR